MNRRLLALVIAGVSAACTPDAATVEMEASVRDSAGVSIVSITSLEDLPTRTLASPVTEIPFDGPTSEASIGRLGAAIRLADGRLVVADGLSRTLKVFDADGEFLTQLGAPDELIMARSTWDVDGTIVGYDRLQRRVSVHSLEGGAGRFWTVDSARVNSRSIGRLDSGEILFRTLVFRAPETGFDTTVVTITANTEGKSVPDTVGRWKAARMGRILEPPAQLVTSPIFEPQLAAIAGLDRVVISNCRSPSVRVIHPDGRLLRIIEWPAPLESVTEDDVRSYRQRHLEGLSREDQRQVRRMLDAKTVAPQLPFCDLLELDTLGRIWVRQFARPGATHRHWLVLSAEGRPLFSVDTPVSARVMHIGEDHLVIYETDAPAGNRVGVYAFD